MKLESALKKAFLGVKTVIFSADVDESLFLVGLGLLALAAINPRGETAVSDFLGALDNFLFCNEVSELLAILDGRFVKTAAAGNDFVDAPV